MQRQRSKEKKQSDPRLSYSASLALDELLRQQRIA